MLYTVYSSIQLYVTRDMNCNISIIGTVVLIFSSAYSYRILYVHININGATQWRNSGGGITIVRSNMQRGNIAIRVL